MSDVRPVAVFLHADAETKDWNELLPLVKMHADTVALAGDDATAAATREALAAFDDTAIVAVVAIGSAAHAAYELAADGTADALVLIAVEPPDAATADRLMQLEIPAFLVWGEDDEVLPVAIGENLTETLPGATLAVVPESGNDVLVVDGPTIVPLIKEYLKVRVFGLGGHNHAAEPVMLDVSFTRPPEREDQPRIED